MLSRMPAEMLVPAREVDGKLGKPSPACVIVFQVPLGNASLLEKARQHGLQPAVCYRW